jgi:hypothetical protein
MYVEMAFQLNLYRQPSQLYLPRFHPFFGHPQRLCCLRSCCAPSCPASPKTFFSFLRALNNHCNQAHPLPRPPSPTDKLPPQNTAPPSPLSISTQLLHSFSPPNTTNHWEHGLNFINSVYHHKPLDFRTTWCHLVRSRNLSAFSNLQASII